MLWMFGLAVVVSFCCSRDHGIEQYDECVYGFGVQGVEKRIYSTDLTKHHKFGSGWLAVSLIVSTF